LKISDLSPVGADLFEDAESYLTELTEQEMEIIVGGLGVLEMVAPADAVIDRSYVNSANIDPEVFGEVPADGLKFFTLYQRYDSLGEAIAKLADAFEPCCLTHNDLKLNNILLPKSWEKAFSSASSLTPSLLKDYPMRFIDWERSAWGDPAFDLGMLIASYLQMWLYSLVTNNTSLKN
jgi:hypothetical protein